MAEDILQQDPGPQKTGIARFTNETPAPGGTNYGVLVDVSGAAVNYAVKAEGAIVSDSYVIGYGYGVYTPPENKCKVLSVYDGEIIYNLLLVLLTIIRA